MMMMVEKAPKTIVEWLEAHPYTLGYVALIATLTFILQLVEVITN